MIEKWLLPLVVVLLPSCGPPELNVTGYWYCWPFAFSFQPDGAAKEAWIDGPTKRLFTGRYEILTDSQGRQAIRFLGDLRENGTHYVTMLENEQGDRHMDTEASSYVSFSCDEIGAEDWQRLTAGARRY